MSKSETNIRAIELLLVCGYTILVVKTSNETQYWSVTSFTPNSGGSEPIEFVAFDGVNVTELVELLSNVTKSEAGNLYDRFIEDRQVLSCKLPKYAEWQWFTL